jgi:hypothetical protein
MYKYLALPSLIEPESFDISIHFLSLESSPPEVFQIQSLAIRFSIKSS